MFLPKLRADSGRIVNAFQNGNQCPETLMSKSYKGASPVRSKTKMEPRRALRYRRFGDFEPSTLLAGQVLDGIRKGFALSDYTPGARIRLKKELNENFAMSSSTREFVTKIKGQFSAKYGIEMDDWSAMVMTEISECFTALNHSLRKSVEKIEEATRSVKGKTYHVSFNSSQEAFKLGLGLTAPLAGMGSLAGSVLYQ